MEAPELLPSSGPPVGSWAETARLMASFGSDPDMDWDAWKDEMKEGDCAEEV